MASALLNPKTREGDTSGPLGGNRKGRRNTAYHAKRMKIAITRKVLRSIRRGAARGAWGSRRSPVFTGETIVTSRDGVKKSRVGGPRE
jgi:hypothetical protein